MWVDHEGPKSRGYFANTAALFLAQPQYYHYPGTSFILSFPVLHDT